jgi:hypothetical protein
MCTGGFLAEGKNRPELGSDHSPHLVLSSRMSRSYIFSPSWCLYGVAGHFILPQRNGVGRSAIWRWQPSGIQRRAISLKQTEVSEVRTVCMIRALMEAVRTSETSAYFKETTRRYIPESCHLHTRHCVSLKSHEGELIHPPQDRDQWRVLLTW